MLLLIDRAILPQRTVHDFREGRLRPHGPGILTDAVEDDDRVIDREAQDGQWRGYVGSIHLDIEQRREPTITARRESRR